MNEPYRITLPERFDPGSLRALRDAVEGIPTNGSVVVVGASEEVFSRGLGLERLWEISALEREVGLADFQIAIMGLARCPAPTVAAIRGPAMGGGLGVAAACDVVLATEEARFALPEPIFGLVPGLILPVLRTRLSGAALRRLAIRGESFSAENACAEGLVDEVVEVGDLDGAVVRWLRLLSRADRGAVGRLKSWLASMDELEVRVDEGRRLMGQLLGTREFRTRVERFERGLAPWEVDDEAP